MLTSFIAQICHKKDSKLDHSMILHTYYRTYITWRRGKNPNKKQLIIIRAPTPFPLKIWLNENIKMFKPHRYLIWVVPNPRIKRWADKHVSYLGLVEIYKHRLLGPFVPNTKLINKKPILLVKLTKKCFVIFFFKFRHICDELYEYK